MELPTTISCDAVVSDAVLQAARDAMPADAIAHLGPDWRPIVESVGEKQAPLIALLGALLDATAAVAAAVADNAWDDSNPLPRVHVDQLSSACYRMAADVVNAGQCPSAEGWSLPSMTGKELV